MSGFSASAYGAAINKAREIVPAPLRNFRSTLVSGTQSQAINVIGDSTGNETTEWVYLTATAIAAMFPNLRVQYRLWNDTNKNYDAWVVIQAGAGQEYVQFAGYKSRFIPVTETTTPSSAVVEYRVLVAMDDWTPAASQRLVGRFTSTGGPVYVDMLSVSGTTGLLNFLWTDNGVTARNLQSSVAPTIADGQPLWLKVIFTPDNGAVASTVSFWTSPATDGVTWTQLGTTQTQAGVQVLTVNNTTDIYRIGGAYNINVMNGKIYEVEIRDGVDGEVINPQPITVWRMEDVYPTDTSVTGGGPTLYINNMSMPGQGFTYFTTNIAKINRNFLPSLTLLSTSHNEGGAIGKEIAATLAAWLTPYRVRNPMSTVIGILQNPETAPSARFEAHNRRVNQFKQLYPINTVPTINVYDDFVQSRLTMSLLVNASDGVHPTALGEQRWANLVISALTW